MLTLKTIRRVSTALGILHGANLAAASICLALSPGSEGALTWFAAAAGGWCVYQWTN